MSRISEQIETIRALIREPPRRAAIRQNDEDWQRLCRSLDALGDTEMAFEAYSQMSDSDPPGSSYMLVYGFVQALSIQQDAVRCLHRALDIVYEPDPVLDEIRAVRNAVTHPSDGRFKEFRLVARSTLDKYGFTLCRAKPATGEQEYQDVGLIELLDKQRTAHEFGLKALIEALRKQEMEYRERYRDEPLASVLPPVLDYYFEKLYEAACGNESWEFGTLHMDRIREAVKRFQAALTKRQLIGVYDNIEYRIEQITYPLQQLAHFFEERGKGRLNARDAEIHIAFMRCKVSELRKAVLEIDAEIAAPLEIRSD